MAARLGLILLLLIAIAVGLRLYHGGSDPGVSASSELLNQLPPEPGEADGFQPLPNFPTTFPSDLPTPKPDMSPDESVRTIMAALHDNDTPIPHSGIATTFNFASPANKAATGPLARFAVMVHNPAYLPLINHKSSRVSAPDIREDVAILRVDITDTQGQPFTYLWQMSKHPDGTGNSLWMTDSVQPVIPQQPEPSDKPGI